MLLASIFSYFFPCPKQHLLPLFRSSYSLSSSSSVSFFEPLPRSISHPCINLFLEPLWNYLHFIASPSLFHHHLSLSLSYTLSPSLTYTLSLSLSLTLSLTLSLLHTLSLTHTLSLSYTLSLSHTSTLSLSHFGVLCLRELFYCYRHLCPDQPLGLRLEDRHRSQSWCCASATGRTRSTSTTLTTPTTTVCRSRVASSFRESVLHRNSMSAPKSGDTLN